MSAPVASGWSGRRGGLAPTGKAAPCHGARGEEPFPICPACEAHALKPVIDGPNPLHRTTCALTTTPPPPARAGSLCAGAPLFHASFRPRLAAIRTCLGRTAE